MANKREKKGFICIELKDITEPERGIVESEVKAFAEKFSGKHTLDIRKNTNDEMTLCGTTEDIFYLQKSIFNLHNDPNVSDSEKRVINMLMLLFSEAALEIKPYRLETIR